MPFLSAARPSTPQTIHARPGAGTASAVRKHKGLPWFRDPASMPIRPLTSPDIPNGPGLPHPAVPPCLPGCQRFLVPVPSVRVVWLKIRPGGTPGTGDGGDQDPDARRGRPLGRPQRSLYLSRRHGRFALSRSTTIDTTPALLATIKRTGLIRQRLGRPAALPAGQAPVVARSTARGPPGISTSQLPLLPCRPAPCPRGTAGVPHRGSKSPLLPAAMLDWACDNK